MVAWPNDAGFDTAYQELEPVKLEVKGEIPPYAAGVLYRTGPLGYKAKSKSGKEFAANHWFDGFSCVHRFQIDVPEKGQPVQVNYRSRRTVDEYLEHVRETGKGEGLTFANKRDPCESFFKKVMAVFVPPGRANKSVGVTLSINMPAGDRMGHSEKTSINGHTNGIQTLHAKSDHHMVKKIDPETLEPQGIAVQHDLHPELKGSLSAAHAKSDPRTGDIFNFNLDCGRQSTYRIFRTSASTGKTDVLATFQATPAYIHSLFLTENYVILCVWNSHYTSYGASLLYHQNVIQAIAPFDRKDKAMWYVVDRTNDRGLVATYKSSPLFSFHSVNAWEEPSSTNPSQTDIVTELSLFENTDVIHRFYYDNLLSSLHSKSDYVGEKRLSSLPMQAQFRLPNVPTETTISKPQDAERLFLADKMVSIELPTINPLYLTKRHRYTYGCADRLKSSFMDGIAKFDNTTQTSIFWEQEGHTPGEPIFVADPEGTEEDDGVLLTVVLDGYVERSYLLVLRAKDLTELGRAEVPGPVAFGFHGAFKGDGMQYSGDI
ncbi:hypothetical protein E8E12_007844 [Didymella heteroderae]|uniref:Dioxygenase n=1 Tax=Didymella heteroderae TaxID=1769908 RepID=A0A9P4WR58_9PLEO|nr:hypothetical protein E8E12_007844 [Didymella heteroderae]